MEQAVIELFDRQGAMTEFTVECLDCPIHIRIAEGIRGPGRGDYYCEIIKKDCPWVTHSKRGNGIMNFAPSARVFNKYGFDLINSKSTYKIGKCHFLYFFFHPDANWQPPQETPDGQRKNRFGKIIQPDDIWELCHIDGIFWNDTKRNLQWNWRSEHKVLEPNTRRKGAPKNLIEAGIPR